MVFNQNKDNKMNKFLILIAAGLILQATPVFADNHKGGEGKRFENHDLNGDGSISQDEFVEHAKKSFAKRDTNGDGMISKDEAKMAKDKKKSEMKEKRKEMRQKMKDKMHDKKKEYDTQPVEGVTTE